MNTLNITEEPEGIVLDITRVFDAPRELVFEVWTQPEHFARWYGPKGATMPFCTMDARPGGTLHFCHRFPDYEDVWVRGVYDEVVPPERIVCTSWFSDAEGRRVERPGFPPEMQVTVSFAEKEGRTELTARHTGLVVDQGEVQGWTEVLDRLEDYLKANNGSLAY
ncbi:MAG TPA: SRPBCC domain-containing protein [Rhodothermales bacterium]|nr:SRPBCC domain-containing protein [Rhodothermales bacterium]